jgi:PAS domain S-box-containing protein
LIAIYFLGSFHSINGKNRNLKFERISLDDGLSQSVVTCILQDSRGFMWFGTQDGLNRYNGYEFKVYRYNPEDSTSIADNSIICIYENRDGDLWIGTDAGVLSRFDRKTERFEHHRFDSVYPGTNNITVMSILEDSHEERSDLWIGTLGGGLFKFDRREERFIHYDCNAESSGIGINQIYCIFEYNQGILWLGTDEGLVACYIGEETFVRLNYLGDDFSIKDIGLVTAIREDRDDILWIGSSRGGLIRFDRRSSTVRRWDQSAEYAYRLSDMRITSIDDDGEGSLWIGTYGGGLNRFDRKKERFAYYANQPENLSSLSNDYINSVYTDRSGILWIGTDNGLNKLNLQQEQFVHFCCDPRNPNSLNNNCVWSFFEDRKGNLWVGTNEGLCRLNRKTGVSQSWIHDPDDPMSLSHNSVLCIHEDRSGRLWFGTRRGLNLFDYGRNAFIRYSHDPNNTNSLSNDFIINIREDSNPKNNVLWIGTHDGGLNRYDVENDEFTHFRYDPQIPGSLSHDYVSAICQDSEGRLWIGTGNGGLNRYDNRNQQFVHYTRETHKLSNNRVTSVYRDKSGILWVGTYGGGLNRFDEETQNFVYFHEADGLADGVVYSILEDNDGYLWMSTNKGLSKFDPRTQIFTNFNVSHGLQSNEFNQGAYYKTRSGEMIFGGINGFNVFHPDSLRDDLHMPPIVITDFQLLNESVELGNHSPLQMHITETKGLRLSHKDDVFSFLFAALDYQIPEKNQYAYKLEGFAEDWHHIGTRRFVTFTNLDPGNYVFRVKGSNSDGVWNEEGTSLEIRIDSPYWDTWWFLGIVILFGIGLIYGFHRYRLGLLNMRAEILESEVNERTSDLTLSNKKLLKQMQERKKAEKALKESEAKYRTITENVNIGVFRSRSGSRGNFIEVNPAAIRMFGYDNREEFMQIPMVDLFRYPEDLQKLSRKLREEGFVTNEEFQLKKKDEMLIWGSMTVVAVVDIQGKIRYYDGVIEDITEGKRIKEALIKNEERYRHFINQSTEGIWRLELEKPVSIDLPVDEQIQLFYRYGYVAECNDTMAIMYGLSSADEIVGARLVDLHGGSDNPQNIEEHRKFVSSGYRVTDGETVEVDRKGNKRYILNNAMGIIENGCIVGVWGMQRDITERKRAEEKIKASLKEKEILLKEIHHRVKNNMQVVSSLLHLQSQGIEDKKTLEMFRESQDRVRSMALVHEKLYASQDLSNINFDEYITGLAMYLYQSYKIDRRKVRLEINADGVSLGVNQAVPCGLILNELISNALKHAFPSNRKSKKEIKISLQKKGNKEIELIVADNGVGIPPDIHYREAQSLGLRLVTILVEDQLQGKIRLNRSKGTRFHIHFKESMI